MRKFLGLCCFWMCFTTILVAQNTVLVKGLVLDENKKPLSQVQIQIIGFKEIDFTDSQGRFELSLEPKKEYLITFYHPLYLIQTKKIVANAGVLEFKVSMNNDLLQYQQDTILVTDNKKKEDATTVEVNTKNLETFVSANDDGLSIIKSQASVSSNSELSSAYSVRGGNFDENMIYVNGVQVFRPFLVRSGEQEGLSFVNTDLIQEINFSAGGFEAKYGDKMSSVLDIKYRDPKEFKSSINLSLLGVRAHTEGVIGKFSYLAGYRYRSNAYLLGTLDTKAEFQPRFMDFQGMFNYQISKKLKLSWLSNVSTNTFEMIPVSRSTRFGGVGQAFQLNVFFDGKEITQFKTNFNSLNLTYLVKDNTILNFSSSYFITQENESFDIAGAYRLGELEANPASDNFGEITTLLGTGSFLNHARNSLNANIFNINHDGKHYWDKFKLLWGASYQKEVINDEILEWQYRDSSGFSLPINSANVEVLDFQKASSSLTSNRFLAYVQGDWNILKNDSVRVLKLVGGTRFQTWDYNNENLISPRVSLIYKPSITDSLGRAQKSKITYRLAWGVYYQPPLYRDLRNRFGILQEGLQAQKSVHYVAGMDYDFVLRKRAFNLRNELYYKQLSNLIPFEVDNVRIRYFGENSGSGYATGFESRISGEFIKGLESWMSIAIMQTREKINNYFYYDYYTADGERVFKGAGDNSLITDSVRVNRGFMPRPTDQLYNIKFFVQDQMPQNPAFKVHMNFVYAGGVPFGPPDDVQNRNTLRMPPYRRVDIGFSWYYLENKKIRKGTEYVSPNQGSYLNKFSDIWFRLEVFNLLNINNTISYLWVTDVLNRQYAVPNYLTQRLINIRIAAKF